MSTTRLDSLPSPVSHVAFAASGDGDDIGILLSDGSILVAESQGKGWDAPRVLGRVDHKKPADVMYRQLMWANSDTVMTISTSLDLFKEDEVLYFKLNLENVKDGIIPVISVGSVVLEGSSATHVVRLNSSLRTGVMLVEFKDGTVVEVKDSDGFWTSEYLCTFPTVCPWISSLQIGPSPDDQMVQYRFFIFSRCLKYPKLTNDCLHAL
jgi:hypothetical protein